MSEPVSISVDVVSDVVCPWCFIGQKRLDKAIGTVEGVDVHVSWRPFQLDPTIPAQGKDRREYMLAKFGSEERIRDIHARIEPLGAAEGIAFDLWRAVAACVARGQPTEGAGTSGMAHSAPHAPGNLSGTKDRGVISPTGIAPGSCTCTRRTRKVPVVEMTPFCIVGRRIPTCLTLDALMPR